ncbi:MAG: hypothetical protein F4148_05775 [Caldilineaceae bacterium SB0675_bin_29]|uniref:Uncharacterized protein n=1 Tax=Caldilineaceae bacterium SB0675_bin_29 TaxID=2605266 RepID=A0A6B1FVX8_9CHLR|nr:hypothetical protein [Caldilineaceae bacterium SB0675_bin_29]
MSYGDEALQPIHMLLKAGMALHLVQGDTGQMEGPEKHPTDQMGTQAIFRGDPQSPVQLRVGQLVDGLTPQVVQLHVGHTLFAGDRTGACKVLIDLIGNDSELVPFHSGHFTLSIGNLL